MLTVTCKEGCSARNRWTTLRMAFLGNCAWRWRRRRLQIEGTAQLVAVVDDQLLTNFLRSFCPSTGFKHLLHETRTAWQCLSLMTKIRLPSPPLKTLASRGLITPYWPYVSVSTTMHACKSCATSPLSRQYLLSPDAVHACSCKSGPRSLLPG